MPKRPNIWQRYSVTQAFAKNDTTDTAPHITGFETVYFGSSYSFDPATGKFTLAGNITSGRIDIGIGLDANQYPYLSTTLNSKVSSELYYFKNLGYDIHANVSWSVTRGAMGGHVGLYTRDGLGLDVSKLTSVQTEAKGSYIDDVFSDDENAYPDNGIQDGYWYVKIT